MKNILKIVTVLLALGSCSSEEIINEDIAPKLLIKEVFGDGTGFISGYRYEYDDENRLITKYFDGSITTFSKVEYVYEDDKLQEINSYNSNGDLVDKDEIRYIDNRIIKKDIDPVGFEDTSYSREFSFDSESRIIQLVKKSGLGNTISEGMIYNFDYIEGNIVKVVSAYVEDNNMYSVGDYYLIYFNNSFTTFSNASSYNAYVFEDYISSPLLNSFFPYHYKNIEKTEIYNSENNLETTFNFIHTYDNGFPSHISSDFNNGSNVSFTYNK